MSIRAERIAPYEADLMVDKEDRRTPLIVAICGALILGIGLAVALGIAAVWALTWPEPPSLAKVPEDQRLSLLQLALAASAFTGGAVALTVAYRKQQLAEAAHVLALTGDARDDTRGYNERFGSASAQLGHENAAVRLAGVYAIAGLADDWAAQKQVCVDVLCAYLRMPFEPTSALPGEAEVRRTVIRTIVHHLQVHSAPEVASWIGLDLDFTGAVLDAASFVRANFANSVVLFDRVTFVGRRTTFYRSRIVNATLFFRRARFEGNDLSFELADINSGSTLNFEGALISTTVFRFTNAALCDCRVSLIEAQIQTELDVDGIKIENSVFAHSREWTPPNAVATSARVETIDDLWRQYGPPSV